MPSPFEYDESDESDEAFESSDESDEAFESSDESDEAFEASDESDEAFEASDESDEAFEASDESDEAFESAGESDESADESVAFSASAGVNQDRQRRTQWQRKIAADQRADVRRASATQREIARQLRVVQRGGRAKIQPVRPLQGSGVFVAELENGRRAKMRTMPPMATQGAVNQVRAGLLANERRAAVAIESNRKAIAGLAKAQADAAKRLTAQQLKSDAAFAKRLVEIDKRVSKELSSGKGSLGMQRKRLMRMLKGERRRSMLNNVLIASAMPFFAAYGNRSSPFHRDNLVLTGSLLGFLVGDEVIGKLAPTGKNAKTWRSGANTWSYLAPPAFGAASWYLFKDRLNQRFVTGTKTFTLTGNSASETVLLTIPEDSVEDFIKEAHPAVVTIVTTTATGSLDVTASPTQTVNSSNASTLTINVKSSATEANASVTVAWMVDMKPSEG